MDRRRFLRTTGTLIAGASLNSEAVRKALEAEARPESRSGRLVLPLN